ncbi:MAG: energy transducer TonB [Deltaproteobacteria bacterium]|nr:energy transducer TonB [Deltaproteobacteria bacterium]
MFDDFRQTTASSGDRRRLGPFIAAAILYGSIAAGAVAATAYVKTTVDEERLAQVTFVQRTPEPQAPEPPPPPPPPPPPVARPRPAAQRVHAARGRPRAALEAPTEIPRERLDESDRALVDAPTGDPGDIGTEDGTGDAPESTAPRPPPRPAPPPPAPRVAPRPVVAVTTVERITAASILPGNRPPAYPEAARRSGLQSIVFARVTIDEQGNVVGVQVLRGDEAFHDVVRSALLAWRYTPARDAEGQAIRSTKIVRIPFRLAT